MYRSIYASRYMHSCSWLIHWYSCWCVSLCHLCGVILYGSVGGFCSLLHFKKIQRIITQTKSPDSTIVYDEVGTNKNTKVDAMEMNTNAYGRHVSQNH